MDIKRLIDNIVDDIGIVLLDEFDRNFERKAFFDKKWKPVKHQNHRGSLMLRTGKLRRSINRSKSARRIRFSSSVPYAKLMNEGGEIIVTAKMKRFFWAMYHQEVGKTQKASNRQLQKIAKEAMKWKAMAMQPVGSKMVIDQRQFIGWHPKVDKLIDDVVKDHLKELNKQIIKKLKR